jgi:hypothetical protein
MWAAPRETHEKLDAELMPKSINTLFTTVAALVCVMYRLGGGPAADVAFRMQCQNCERSVKMQAETLRELAKDICVLVVQKLNTDVELTRLTEIRVDVQRLYSWMCAARANALKLSEESVLEAAMGYNSFCTDVVACTTRGVSETRFAQ